jgi:predicted glutamine amidotransferase
MCRLLAHVARRPLTVAQAMGASDLETFIALAPRNPDGWGIAWWPSLPAADAADGPEAIRSVANARDDPGFRRAMEERPALAALVHLRGATPGLSIGLENCHPFTRNRAAFAQNGALYPQDRLDEIVPAGLEREIAGSTDSERFFVLLQSRLEGSPGSFDEVVSELLAELLRDFTTPCLNAIFLGPEAIYVLNAHNPTTLPNRTDPHDLFAIRYRVAPGLVVVASSGFDQPESRGWRTLDNMTVLEVRLDSLELQISALAGVPVPSYRYDEPGAVSQITE